MASVVRVGTRAAVLFSGTVGVEERAAEKVEAPPRRKRAVRKKKS